MGADQRAGGPSLPDDPAALEAIIDARRRHLSDTVDELVVRTRPKEIARRSAADAQQRARAFVTTEDGQPRYERIGAAAAAAVLLVVLVVVRRRAGGRG
jgi:adenylate kinase